MILYYLFGWFLMIFLAIGNGMLREALFARHLGELRAHQLSSLTAIIIFGIFIWGLSRFWPLDSVREAVIISLLWVVMTVAFEFVFGHFVAGHSWSRLLADYNLLAGRLWILVLLWIGAAPLVFYLLR